MTSGLREALALGSGPLPLSEYLVVELGGGIASAFCTRLLTDFGATVIKLENPDGDPLRLAGSPVLEDQDAAFLYRNARKLSVGFDAFASGSDSLLSRLLVNADALVTDVDAATLQALGLSNDALAVAHPGLVHVSVRPYGLSGPRAQLPGFDLDVFHSAGEGKLLPGGLSYQAFPDRQPLLAGRHTPSYDSGIAAATAVCAALLHRSAGAQRGALVDVSEQDVQIGLNRVTLDLALNQGVTLDRAHRGYDFGGIFRCADGYVTVRPNEDRHWTGMATAMNRQDLADDDRFSTRRARECNADALNAVVSDFAADKTRDEVYAALSSAGAPVGSFDEPQRIRDSAQFQSRGWSRQATVRGRLIDLPGPPIRMSDTPAPPLAAAPRVAEHDSLVLEFLTAPPEAAIPVDAAVPQISELLRGVRVLDLSWVGAGPFSTQLLAFLGADVIKVESTRRPDLFRRSTNPEVTGLESSTRFNCVNVNKKSIAIALDNEAGRTLVRRLAAQSDVVVENFRPGVLTRLGLDYHTLSSDNPALVLASLSAAGQTGPDALAPGYASIFNAMGGLGDQTGYADGPPVEVRDSVDFRVGSAMALGITAALIRARRTGHGQWVDVSAREAIAALVGEAFVELAFTGSAPRRHGNARDGFAPHDVYPCRGVDQWIAVAVSDDGQWRAFLDVIGRPELMEDPRFTLGADRAAHQRELYDVVSDWTADYLADNAVAMLNAAGVAASVVTGPESLPDDHHVAYRGTFRTVIHPVIGEQIVVGPPWASRSPNAPKPELNCAPLLGEHTDSTLRDRLQLTDDQIDALRTDGVLT